MTPNEIKALMVLHGVKQVDIAAQLNVTQTAVSKVIVGSSVSKRIREKIAKLIGKNFDEVWPGAA